MLLEAKGVVIIEKKRRCIEGNICGFWKDHQSPERDGRFDNKGIYFQARNRRGVYQGSSKEAEQ